MPIAVIKKDNNLKVIKTDGSRVRNVIGHLPDDTAVEDYQFIVECPEAGVKICKSKKSKWLKRQIKNAISE